MILLVKFRKSYYLSKKEFLKKQLEEIQAAIEANVEYIKNEVLAEEILAGGVENGVVLDEEGELKGMRVEVRVKG